MIGNYPSGMVDTPVYDRELSQWYGRHTRIGNYPNGMVDTPVYDRELSQWYGRYTSV